MAEIKSASKVRMIPIAEIDVLNPRERNKNIFDGIVANIKAIGLKKPITVTPRTGTDNLERYLLICGEGRMKAFQLLGETVIPALVVEVSDEDAFIMSLAENIARRQCRPLELLAGIGRLRDQGYDKKIIASKTGLSMEYVAGILTLLAKGESHLLIAVERGRIPLNAALDIVGAGNDDAAVQAALQSAYESGKLRGKQLLNARRFIESRRNRGRAGSGVARHNNEITTSSLVRTYQKEVERQRSIVKRAEYAQQRLLFVVGALRQLLADENFTTLLRAEHLDTLPKYLADRVWGGGQSS
jgi:ParB family chromosome partitioning protein